MEVRHYTDKKPRSWFRCKTVFLADGKLTWELDPRGGYDLGTVYSQAPHRELVAAKDDNALRLFVRRWGPLRLEERGSDSIVRCRELRDELSAWMKLFGAVKENSMPAIRSAVTDILRLNAGPFIVYVRHRLSIPGAAAFDEQLEKRLASANFEETFHICALLLGSFSGPAFGHKLIVERSRQNVSLKAKIDFLGLTDALHWMLWQDVFTQKPFSFCEECGDLIEFTSRHARKFCPGRCAKRKHDRESKRWIRSGSPSVLVFRTLSAATTGVWHDTVSARQSLVVRVRVPRAADPGILALAHQEHRRAHRA